MIDDAKIRISLRRIIVGLLASLSVVVIGCSSASTPNASLPTEQLPTSPAPKQTATRTAQLLPTPKIPPTVSDGRAKNTGVVFLQLTDPLDEPEFYCVDVPGAGRGVRLDGDLQAHTCKPISGAEDELFSIDHPSAGQIFMEAYGLCVEADLATAGAALSLQPCSDSALQRFALDNDLILLDESDLCLSVADGPGIPTGGPSHLRRNLTFEKCGTIDSKLARWSIGLFDY